MPVGNNGMACCNDQRSCQRTYSPQLRPPFAGVIGGGRCKRHRGYYCSRLITNYLSILFNWYYILFHFRFLLGSLVRVACELLIDLCGILGCHRVIGYMFQEFSAKLAGKWIHFIFEIVLDTVFHRPSPDFAQFLRHCRLGCLPEERLDGGECLSPVLGVSQAFCQAEVCLWAKRGEAHCFLRLFDGGVPFFLLGIQL